MYTGMAVHTRERKNKNYFDFVKKKERGL